MGGPTVSFTSGQSLRTAAAITLGGGVEERVVVAGDPLDGGRAPVKALMILSVLCFARSRRWAALGGAYISLRGSPGQPRS